MNKRIHVILACIVTCAFACTSQKNEATGKHKLDKPFFGFDHQQTQRLNLAKNDPETGDHWAARLEKTGEDFRIANTDAALGDRLADTAFILHLLDTLRTVHPVAEAPRGPLASYGLAPPVFNIRVEGPDGIQELEIGATEGQNRYRRFARLVSDNTIWLVEGAALDMLGRLNSFEVLRRRTLVPFSADDVDEVELYKGAGGSKTERLFYAQRETDDWVDQRRKKLPGDVEAFLEAQTHLRVARFIDDPQEEKRLAPLFQRRPAFRVVFKDRKGRPSILTAAADSGHLYASMTGRDSVFELFPESLRHFRLPPRSVTR